MAVYLGDNGLIEIGRGSNSDGLRSILGHGDVTVERSRFSVDFAYGALITGDQVDIKTTDHSPLELVASHTDSDGRYFPDWRGYISVDAAGGIRLYRTQADALVGGYTKALSLVTPSRDVPIEITVRNSRLRCLAQVRSYELTTSRESVQVTELGSEFQQQYEAGLISGQGRVDCFWEHQLRFCDPNGVLSNPPELPIYLAYLVRRVEQGAAFNGRFYLYRPDTTQGEPVERSVWYEARCLVTNVAVSVEPTQAIQSTIYFVTTGEISLRLGAPPSYILQEDGALILQEDGVSGLLQEDPT